jgi:hypothetical protein
MMILAGDMLLAQVDERRIDELRSWLRVQRSREGEIEKAGCESGRGRA